MSENGLALVDAYDPVMREIEYDGLLHAGLGL